MSDNLSNYQFMKRDPRYLLDAYKFVRDGLSYATEVLQLGSRRKPKGAASEEARKVRERAGSETGGELTGENHLTGQELCEALRLYAVAQYGFMAKSVLNSWGIHCTGDFGNIVYNMIDIGMMKKSEKDQRDHFDDVYDFQEVFVDQFEIQRAE